MNSNYNPYQSPAASDLPTGPYLVPDARGSFGNERPHSGLGIASLILSLASASLMFLLILTAGFIQASTRGGMDKESNIAIVVGLGIFGLLFLSLIAFVLGIAGLFQKDRMKLFDVLGILFSGGTIVGTVLLIIIGLAMKHG